MTLKTWVCGFVGCVADVSLSLHHSLHRSCISMTLPVELDLGPNLGKNKKFILLCNFPARLVSQLQFTMQ